ncbi:10308_t:CDS:2 [Funneliformis geosporum]|nr:10308_t:CDS:2 [Funneliformis geosporum]
MGLIIPKKFFMIILASSNGISNSYKLKELICKYLEENREDEPYAELTVNYYQDKEGNYTNKGNEYIEVRQEIYKGDKNENDYFLIIDKNGNEKMKKTQKKYYCFPKAMSKGWNYLKNNWKNIKEIELRFEINRLGNKQVVDILDPNDFSDILERIDEIIESTKKNRHFIKWEYPVDKETVIEKTEYVKYCADCDNTLSVINPSDYCSKSCEKNLLDELKHTKNMLESGEVDL